jgi:DNA-3-methyladenine glycosylase
MIPEGNRLDRSFFMQDVLDVAPGLLGQTLATALPGQPPARFIITEVEAYRGTEDKACHASKGRTARTEVMFLDGGHLYVYLIYGMYWMLNVVTGGRDNPQAVLIRGISGFGGPGKLTRKLGIDRSLNGVDAVTSDRLWFEESGLSPEVKTGMRIGIDYAGDYWKSLPWRYYI